MNRDDTKEQIKNRWQELIPDITGAARQKVNGKTSWICPKCGHGQHGDGLTFNPKSEGRTGLKCFSCGWHGDIIALYQETTGADYNTALNDLAGKLNIEITAERPQIAPNSANRNNEQNNAPETIKADFGAYFRECAKNIEQAADYLQSRGISLETAKAYSIGYDPEADPASAPGGQGKKVHPCNRIIIPCGNSFYVARSTDSQTPANYKKINPKGAAQEPFNMSVLEKQEVRDVFITEGAFDALAIIEAGADAIATNSTSGIDKLLERLKENRSNKTFIIALDNDGAGNAGKERLEKGLQALGLLYTCCNICGDSKDPNEALTADPELFKKEVAGAMQDAKEKAAAGMKPDNTLFYIDNFMRDEMTRFKADKKTGFAKLDELAGGLYSGLYVLAAISSLGKTSFALQLADQLAEQGQDVLFFSLEQSRFEMVSKSLARIEYKEHGTNAATSLQIRKGYKPEYRENAIDIYKQNLSDRISIIEGNYTCDISFISDYIKGYIARTDSRPVVFIDYLQILQPGDKIRRMDQREIIDTAITSLKRISRDLDLTIFAISSVNRSNYQSPIDFESLKESGCIEYTADVVWGLQLRCVSENTVFEQANKLKEKREAIKKAKAETPRKIELCCLKNRYGIANYSCYFDYYPANDFFTEGEEREELPWKDNKNVIRK